MRISDWSSDVCSSDLHDLGIAAGEEPVAAFLERRLQFLVIVDDAVEDERQPEFGIDHRLTRPVRQVDDAQAAVAERDAVLEKKAFSVRAAAGLPAVHRRHCRRGGRAVSEPDFTGDTAHVALSFRRSEEHTYELQSLMRIPYAVCCFKKIK